MARVEKESNFLFHEWIWSEWLDGQNYHVVRDDEVIQKEKKIKNKIKQERKQQACDKEQ